MENRLLATNSLGSTDLLLSENKAVPGVPIDDVEEVSNYMAAMQRGFNAFSLL
jgi:hypothetical protein